MPAPTAILAGILEALITEATIELSREANSTQMGLDSYIATLEASAISEESIREMVFGGGSKVASTFTEAYKRKIVSIIDQSINKAWGDGMTARQALEGKQRLFTWRVESAKPCPDCSARNGQKRSLSEWQLAGLPRSGWSLCRKNCKCILDSKGAGNFNYKRKRGLG